MTALPTQLEQRSAGRKDWSRTELPIGTIRVRTNGATGRCHRDVKVRMDGAKGQRWMGYARWWWLNNKGPIPKGLFVLHRDGDTMNDDPSNYVLGNAGHNVQLQHRADPELARRNRQAASDATARSNTLRSKLRRLREWLPSRWYPVDPVQKIIHNKPVKTRYSVWPAIGLTVPVSLNGDGADAAALGWEGLAFSEAVILAALYTGPLDVNGLLKRVNELRVERGDSPFADVRALYQWTSPLGQKKMITVERRYRRSSLYAITPTAAAARSDDWTPVVPVRGEDLRGAAYRGYRSADAPKASTRRPSPAQNAATTMRRLEAVERVVLKLTVFPRMTWTLEELAILLKMTKSNVALIEQRAIQKIRAELQVEDAA